MAQQKVRVLVVVDEDGAAGTYAPDFVDVQVIDFELLEISRRNPVLPRGFEELAAEAGIDLDDVSWQPEDDEARTR